MNQEGNIEMESKQQKKQLPAYAVLAIIALVAAVVLAVTNLLTRDAIAEHQRAALVQAYGAVMPVPEGGAYDPITEGLEGYDISSLYAAKDAEGNIVGYCVTASGTGYGGPVAVTLGVDTNGLVTGCVVGDTSFAETAGFGTRAREAAFQDQFKGISAIDGGSFEALTGATRTSNAVLDATNRALKAVAEVALKAEIKASPLVSFGVKAAPQIDASAIVPGATLRGTAEGYGGEDVTVTVTLDDNCAIATIRIDASTQTPGFGQRCAEDTAWQSGIIGQTIPVTVDALSGATITSGAVQDAINGAEPAEAETSASVAVVIARDDAAALGLHDDGTASVNVTDGFTGTVTVTLNVKDGKVSAGTVTSEKPTLAPNADGSWTASANGFAGKPVKVTIKVDADGNITSISVDASTQTEYIGTECESKLFTQQFVGKTAPFALGENVDAHTGATVTSQAVVDALNSIFELADFSRTAFAGDQSDGLLRAEAEGFGGGVVKVTVGVNEDGTVATLSVDASTQTEYIGTNCESKTFTQQFVGKAGPFVAGENVDVQTGATITSNAVIAAVNQALGLEEPAPEATPIPVTEEGGVYRTQAVGFGGGVVKVTVTLAEDGTVASVGVDASTQTEYIGTECESKTFTQQFAGKSGPFVAGENVDAVSGATITSNAVIEAVNRILEQK